MTSAKTLAIIGIDLTIISGWDKILNFIESFTQGLTDIWKSLPPFFQMVAIIGIFWLLGKEKK